MSDPTRRFSSRVEDYVKYRPGYPEAVLATLRAHCDLLPTSVVADIGSGTGLLTELFLRNGNPVFAVEPNEEMRVAGEHRLGRYPAFQSIAGTAEQTTLPAQSVDLVAAGQAFHWFDQAKAKSEFRRVLRPGGWVALIWNERETHGSAFLMAYEALLSRYSTDYAQVDHRRIDDSVLAGFFGPAGFKLMTYPNRQHFDHEGLRGRLMSSSYAPEAGHPNHEAMLAELGRIFDACQVDGQVAFEYTTKLFYGRL